MNPPQSYSPHALRVLENTSGWKPVSDDIIEAQEFLNYDDNDVVDLWSLYIITMQESRFMYYMFFMETADKEYVLYRTFPSQILLQFSPNEELYEDVVDDQLVFDYLGLHDDHEIRRHLISKMENSGLTEADDLRKVIQSDLRPAVLQNATIAYWK
jgi:hypothetical protein